MIMDVSEWLGQSLLCEDLLPWESAKEMSISEFLKQYSIHDSDWITLSTHLNPYNAGILAIRWHYPMGSLGHAISVEQKKGNRELDLSGPFISQDEWEVFTKIRPLYATLLIKFEHIENVTILPDDGTVFVYPYGMYAGGIYKGSVEEKDGKQILEVFANFGGIVTIVLTGKTFFLALDDNKNVIEL